MRLLLTGHLGYLGAVMAPMLVSRGHEVVGLDSGLFEACAFQEPSARLEAITKDIRDVQATDLRGFEAVVHLAGLSNDPLGNLLPELTLEINHRATVRLAGLAKEGGVSRFLFSSTCSVYGAAGEHMVTEASAPHPVTAYGRSKVLAEEGLRDLADAGFSPTILRSATASGVSPYLRFDLVLNNLVAWATATGAVRLKSDGTAWRPLVHVEDIARTYCGVLDAPRDTVHNQTINVGLDSENYRILDLAEIVQRTVPGARIEFASNASTDQRCYRVGFGKLAKLLPSCQLQWSAARGAQQLYHALSRAKVGLAEFEGDRYRRIVHAKRLLETGQLDATLRWAHRELG